MKYRQSHNFERTVDVVNCVKNAFHKQSDGNVNKITRLLFQVLRIRTNTELLYIERFLDKVLNSVSKNGLIMCICFQPSEDELVTKYMRSWACMGKGCCLTTKPILPTDEEIAENCFSHSATLRMFLKK